MDRNEVDDVRGLSSSCVPARSPEHRVETDSWWEESVRCHVNMYSSHVKPDLCCFIFDKNRNGCIMVNVLSVTFIERFGIPEA